MVQPGRQAARAPRHPRRLSFKTPVSSPTVSRPPVLRGARLDCAASDRMGSVQPEVIDYDLRRGATGKSVRAETNRLKAGILPTFYRRFEPGLDLCRAKVASGPGSLGLRNCVRNGCVAQRTGGQFTTFSLPVTLL